MHGELSLAQLATWLLAADRPPPDTAPPEPVDPGPYLVDLRSPAGRITLVRPPGSPVWRRGPVPIGYDPARWAA